MTQRSGQQMRAAVYPNSLSLAFGDQAEDRGPHRKEPQRLRTSGDASQGSACTDEPLPSRLRS